MPSTVEIEGLNELNSAFANMAASLSDAIARALSDIANSIADNAQANAPVKTGYLRDHITVTDTSDTTIGVQSSAGYSGFVEYGTRYQNAQPFIGPALDQAQSEIPRIMQDAIESVLS